jgi:HEAT repeat protein
LQINQFSHFTRDGHRLFLHHPGDPVPDFTKIARVKVGLFDFIKNLSGNPEVKAQKAAEMVKNAKAIREDRWAAIEFLADNVNDTEKAVNGLLPRFQYHLEHGINDTREKEKSMDGIVRHGEAAIPFVLEHLRRTPHIAWPIKILKALGRDDQHVVDCLLSALDYSDVSFDQGKTDKNYDILCHLIDYKRPGLPAKIEHFLKDPDERVRYAAAEVLMEQEISEVGDTLERLMRDENPDNSRIRQTVVRKYLEQSWPVKNPDAFAHRHVIGPVFINDQNRLYVAQSQPYSGQ